MTAVYQHSINPGLSSDQRVYKLDPPFKGHKLVVVSTLPGFGDREDETGVFTLKPDNMLGDELHLLKGQLDHEAALKAMLDKSEDQ